MFSEVHGKQHLQSPVLGAVFLFQVVHQLKNVCPSEYQVCNLVVNC